MKKGVITICVIIGLLEVMLVIAYFSVFNGAISTDHQDWNTFLQIFNGFVMAILTAFNIYIFYQLTVAIEDKNHTTQNSFLVSFTKYISKILFIIP